MSRQIDLDAEFNIASDAASPYLIKAGGRNWQRCRDAGGIGLVRAETYEDGTYQPVDEGGTLLWVLPAFHGPVAPSTLADLVAWDPDDPGCWWRRTGYASVLGYAAVQQARQSVWDFGGVERPSPPTLTLHRTPKHYALAGFDGAVVLDWTFGLGELNGVERIICPDLASAEHVQRQIKRNQPRLPAVLVAEQADAA